MANLEGSLHRVYICDHDHDNEHECVHDHNEIDETVDHVEQENSLTCSN